MKRALFTAVLLTFASTAYAGVIGPSWDSGGSCSAMTLAQGVPCVLNPAAQAAAARAGTPMSVLDLEDRSIESGLGRVLEGTYEFSFLAEFTDDWGINEFGWFSTLTATSGVIFSATQGMGATSIVTLPFNAQFYYRNTALPEFFNTVTTPRQFSGWHSGDTLFLGVEDIQAHLITTTWTPGASDYDHNDVFVRFEAVPEPTTLLLLGLGLFGAAAKLRKRA